MKYSDVNQNGILDSHEKWFLGVKVIILSWSLIFLTLSYLGKKEVDRLFVSTTLATSAASFSLRRKTK